MTSLGHVQRGGAPSAFDRYLSTVLGYAAVEQVIMSPGAEAQLIGIRGHQIISSPLMDCVDKTRAVADVIADQDYETAMEMRGGSFRDSFRMIRTMVRAQPHAPVPGQRRLRLAVLHGGGPAPGMNTAVRVAVRVGIDRGHTMLAVRNGFQGLGDGDIDEMDWMSVTGWVSRGGAELGTNRFVPTVEATRPDRRSAGIASHRRSAHDRRLVRVRGRPCVARATDEYPALRVPIVCLPASINNDLPGSELSIGADTALNNIVSDVDKIKQSAVAARTSFVVEVMGRDCGYLALMSGLATGAERVYLPEEGMSLLDLQNDVNNLKEGFEHGKRLGLVIRSEHADPVYTTGFIHALFEREGDGLFDVRQAILGHVQQGGDPSPFDRIQATRLASKCVEYLIEEALTETPTSAFIGLQKGKVRFTPLSEFPALDRDGRAPSPRAGLDGAATPRQGHGPSRSAGSLAPAVPALNQMRSLVAMIVISLFFSAALEPGVRWLHRRYGWSRGASVGVVYLAGVVFVVVTADPSSQSPNASPAHDRVNRSSSRLSWLRVPPRCRAGGRGCEARKLPSRDRSRNDPGKRGWPASRSGTSSLAGPDPPRPRCRRAASRAIACPGCDRPA